MDTGIEFNVDGPEISDGFARYALYYDLEQLGHDELMLATALSVFVEKHAVSISRNCHYIDEKFTIKIDETQCFVEIDPSIATTYISCPLEKQEWLKGVLSELSESTPRDTTHQQSIAEFMTLLGHKPLSAEMEALFEGLGIPLNGSNSAS